MEYLNFIIATFTIRVLVSILFIDQAQDKIFNIGLKEVARTVEQGFRTRNLMIPSWMITLGVYFTAYLELIAGVLLLFGMFRDLALWLLCLDLLVASLGFSLMEPVWDTKHIFPRLAIVVTLLLLPADWDQWRLDYWISIYF